MKKKNWLLILLFLCMPIGVFATMGGDPLVHINGKLYGWGEEEITVTGGKNYKDGFRFEFDKNGSLDSYYWYDIDHEANIIVNGNNEIKKLYGYTVEGLHKYTIKGEGTLVIDEVYNGSPYVILPSGSRACTVYVESTRLVDENGNDLQIPCDNVTYLEKNWSTLRETNPSLPETYSDSLKIDKYAIYGPEVAIDEVEGYVKRAITTDGKVTVDGNKIKIELKGNSQKLEFKDVNTNDWYYDSVKFAYENKIILGYNENTFAPNDKVTRGQLVTILWRMEGNPDASGITNKFSDVPTNDYFTSAVKWAEKNEIVHGYNSKSFGPNDPIVRQDLAVILNNYAKFKGLDSENGDDISTFADYSKVKGAYSENALKWAVKNKVMSGQNLNGKKYISPSNNATRAETAAMISNYINSFE